MNKLKAAMAVAVPLGTSACGSNIPTAILEGTEPRLKISLQFQDFPEGTVCEVVTPDGSVVSPAFPGVVEYPAKYRESPVSCTTPDNSVYDLLMTSVLHENFKMAGLTAYIDGLLVATIAAENLTYAKNESGVVKR